MEKKRTFVNTRRLSDTWSPWQEGKEFVSEKKAPKRKGYQEKFIQTKGRFPDWIEKWSPKVFYITGGVASVGVAGSFIVLGVTSLVPWAVSVPLFYYWKLGLEDMKQTSHTILRNFPVLGHIRYILESVRPEIRQYFIEGDSDENPFDRNNRSIAYSRAKNMSDTLPFGGRSEYYTPGYEWLNHSFFPTTVKKENERILIGGDQCTQPYSASLLNVSAMSFGALSENAILALNRAAKMGDFYHNTGEGGVSTYHLQPGGDIVWNIGTGYFGCRDEMGNFSAQKFSELANHPNIKMIEIKFSQGAKPGHGGILPKGKITPEIARARGVSMDIDCVSPPRHSAFSDFYGLCDFIVHLRELSNGKPIGFKCCVGRPEEFAALIQAMITKNVFPDFITIDGGEGGTGAAPPEFSNHVGIPLIEGLTLAHNLLIGAGIRDKLKIIVAGKIISGFTLVRALALGADVCNSARAMMFALGCIQALKCNTNTCPTGITTQNKELMRGLDISDKSVRVYNFQQKTVETALELIGAAGLDCPSKLEPQHIMKRASSTHIVSYADQYPAPPIGALLNGTARANLQSIWDNGQILLNNQ